MILKRKMLLKTPRLIINRWQGQDAQDLYEYASVKSIGKMAGWKTHQSLAESEQVLAWFISDPRIYAIRDKKTSKAIGSIGFHHPAKEIRTWLPQQRGLELGFVLNQKYWGQGLMPEALTYVIDFLFCVEGVDYLTCCHFTDNFRSKRVIEKLNFEPIMVSMVSDDDQNEREVYVYILKNPNK